MAGPAQHPPAARDSLAVLKYLPASTDPCGLVFYTTPFDQPENQFVTRIDATLSPRDNLYARYFLDGYNWSSPAASAGSPSTCAPTTSAAVPPSA